jgi:hypothetical protein
MLNRIRYGISPWLLVCLVVLVGALGYSGVQASSSRQDLETLNSDWQVSGAGGSKGMTSGYILSGTVGQTAVAAVPGPSLSLIQGFWQDFEPFVCGDYNGDQMVNISDVVAIVDFIFAGAPPPQLLIAADTDCNGLVNVTDAVYIIAFIFQAGPVPCADCQ